MEMKSMIRNHWIHSLPYGTQKGPWLLQVNYTASFAASNLAKTFVLNTLKSELIIEFMLEKLHSEGHTQASGLYKNRRRITKTIFQLSNAIIFTIHSVLPKSPKP